MGQRCHAREWVTSRVTQAPAGTRAQVSCYRPCYAVVCHQPSTLGRYLTFGSMRLISCSTLTLDTSRNSLVRPLISATHREFAIGQLPAYTRPNVLIMLRYRNSILHCYPVLEACAYFVHHHEQQSSTHRQFYPVGDSVTSEAVEKVWYGTDRVRV